MTLATSLLRAAKVHMTFGDGALATPVLHDVDLQLRPGELTLLTGPSGSGKTTLVSIWPASSARGAGRSTCAATASRR
ncbi:MAG: ATP-binding cassette domain-containing protein [Kofleriaceae bacterium]|nr:MAG: ATP-binding cassette domain-containing protein [Kofleriaceae bacterium]